MIGRTTATAAVLLTLAACSSTQPAPDPIASTTATTAPAPASRPPARLPARGVAAVPLPRPADVDRHNPDQIARAALTALYSYDTAADAGPGDAARRAMPWLSADFARDIRVAPPIAPPGALWTVWARHRALVTPRLSAGHDDSPDDTATQVYRQYAVERHPLGRDAWRGPRTRSVVFVRLTRTRAGWHVDQVLPR